jgi:hypothetical protein
MCHEYLRGVNFGLTFGIRYQKLENQINKLSFECNSLRQKTKEKEASHLWTELTHILCNLEDVFRNKGENFENEEKLEYYFNEMFDDVKKIKEDFIKLNASIIDIRAKCGRKRKGQDEVDTPEAEVLVVCKEVEEREDEEENRCIAD